MHVVGGVGWAVGLLRQTLPPFDSAKELADDVGVGQSSYTDYDLEITAKLKIGFMKRQALKSRGRLLCRLSAPIIR